ncbi:MAG: hypothetical protein L3K00_07390 [Thermoplasmata archaeon]|nr:hypothetical protein [Thermoplasmata archaeon]
MSGSLPWSNSAPMAPTNDPNELLRRIEQNTSGMLTWMKILVGAVVVLVIINLFFI